MSGRRVLEAWPLGFLLGQRILGHSVFFGLRKGAFILPSCFGYSWFLVPWLKFLSPCSSRLPLLLCVWEEFWAEVQEGKGSRASTLLDSPGGKYGVTLVSVFVACVSLGFYCSRVGVLGVFLKKK